jgi:hypothetical protein
MSKEWKLCILLVKSAIGKGLSEYSEMLSEYSKMLE